MEYFDVLDENGNPTGKIKEREAVHTDGDLHRTSHIWIVKKDPQTGELLVLLQKRSKNKDSHPSCFDTSSAGHVDAGDDFLPSALRELKEELGITANADHLAFMFSQRTYNEGFFHNKPFKDNQISSVYLLLKPVEITDITVQKSEIDHVEWQPYSAVLKKLTQNNPNYCINKQEFINLGNYLKKTP